MKNPHSLLNNLIIWQNSFISFKIVSLVFSTVIGMPEKHAGKAVCIDVVRCFGWLNIGITSFFQRRYR